MKHSIQVSKTQPLLGLADSIVYMQKPGWCNATTSQLSLSLLAPRQYFPYDDKGSRPLLVFFCGGGFMRMDRNVWMGELAYFAKRGYAVASVEYSCRPTTAWPEQIQEVKQAIRFLRTYAEEFHILPDRIAVMGESAGGYLASLAAVTGETREYDAGEYLDQSSAVQAAVPWYPAIRVRDLNSDGGIRVDISQFADPASLVTANTPPFLLLHGTVDDQVPQSESEYLYDALTNAGVEADLYLLEGANHGDIHFVQEEVKEIILRFLDKHLK